MADLRRPSPRQLVTVVNAKANLAAPDGKFVPFRVAPVSQQALVFPGIDESKVEDSHGPWVTVAPPLEHSTAELVPPLVASSQWHAIVLASTSDGEPACGVRTWRWLRLRGAQTSCA